MKSVRPWLTRIHRWTGLALVLFLLIVGFTGALLPFQGDIQRVLAPTPADQIMHVPGSFARPLDWPVLGAIAEGRTGGLIRELPLHRERDEPATFAIAARPGRPPFGFDTISLDPHTGREVSRHHVGDDGPLRARVMPFLYRLHTSLALGEWGSWLLGVAALAWSIDCFIGFWLTLPSPSVGWWRHWRKAWKLRLPPSSAFRLNFDLHRAAGLWLWPLLFIFAWSSVSLNLRSAYDPVMRMVFAYPAAAAAPNPPTARAAGMNWSEVLRAARRNVAAEGKKRGFMIERERALWIDREGGKAVYVVRTSRDLSTDGANSYFGIDGHTGRITSIELPTGEKSGATIDYWLGVLHTAGIFGLPYRILVSITGIAIVALSTTGIVIWFKKRSARILGKRRSRARGIVRDSGRQSDGGVQDKLRAS